MIVKTGTYDRVGMSTGLSQRGGGTRVSASRGRNHWTLELEPLSYGWPVFLAVFWVPYLFTGEAGIGSVLMGIFIALWFGAVSSSREDYDKHWACSKCGTVWNPETGEIVELV